MCGRYALTLRPGDVRRQFQEMDLHMSIDDDVPADDEVRHTYNFPPGTYGIVFRAEVPDRGAGEAIDVGAKGGVDGDAKDESPVKEDTDVKEKSQKDEQSHKQTHYRIQAMKWGLIPFWTKRNPDYSSMLRTINCRDDSLVENRGMWTTMKMKKRCVIVCDGFYEWLKKNNGKDRIPHYTKRKDGKMMCFAGLWDCVQYEGSDEKLYTYTIITTDSNKQLKFLHDRMPVILENGSKDILTWLDPGRTTWTKELQSLLKPYEGELECYQVNKDVGKVGNNSPSFVVPINSKENKNNIANFFGNQKKLAVKQEAANIKTDEGAETIKQEETEPQDDRRTRFDRDAADSNAPVPEPPPSDSQTGMKREHEQADDEGRESKSIRLMSSLSKDVKPTGGQGSGRKVHSATNNRSAKPKSSPRKAGEGSQKITAFFKK